MNGKLRILLLVVVLLVLVLLLVADPALAGHKVGRALAFIPQPHMG